MKNIIIVIFSLIFITGCSNYNELNDLAIVATIGIEKKQENFQVTLEVFKEDKQSESGSSTKKSLAISGEGKSLDEAINDAAFMSEKLLFFPHLEAIIIDKDLAEDGIDDLMDYLSRYTDFSFQSYVVLSDDIKPSLILEKKDIKTEIIGDSIYSIFNYTGQNNSAFVSNRYFNFLEQYVNPRKDIYLPYIKVKDKKIVVEDAGIFKDSKLVNDLNGTETKSLSLFKENVESLYYKVNINKGYIVMRLFEAKTKFKVENNKIIINIETTSGIDEVNSKINTVDTKNINKINKALEKEIKSNTETLLKTLRENQSDLLALNDKIYKKKGIVDKSWINYEIEVNVNNTITKKGVLMNSVRGES